MALKIGLYPYKGCLLTVLSSIPNAVKPYF